MKGEQILKRCKKTAIWIKWGYVVCIILIISASYWITYKEEKEMPEPINFATNGGIGIGTEQYAYLEVKGLTNEIAIFGDTENESSSSNDRYYIAFDDTYMYIVDLNFETIDLLKPWQEYTYSLDENAVPPEPIKIYGITETIPEELKTLILEYYNEGLSEEDKIKEQDFYSYFGNILLNTRRKPVDVSVQEAIIILSIFSIFILFINHILLSVEKNKVKRYLKKNEYEQDLIEQLDNFVEEKYYNDKIILTKDFFVDIKYGALIVFKYSDVKWIHIHNIKSYGITTSSSLIVYLKDGKTKLTCLKTTGKPSNKFSEIFNTICQKVPQDCLKGYTKENKEAFKEYKKELQENK